MWRDLYLYPNKASRKQLKEYVESIWFTPCEHLWNWPKGTLNYSWFDRLDFKSTDWVSVDIFPVRENEREFTQNEWAIHVRNTYSASWHDVYKLNETLRVAKKLFWGNIRGDYWKNRYAPIWKNDTIPLQRGVSAIYNHVKGQIDAVRFALPKEIISHKSRWDDMDKVIDWMNSSDPSRVIYNWLVPFAVSMFEFFFSQVFKILLRYDSSALEKKSSHKQKIEFSEALELERWELSLEDIIASNYSFQNLRRLNEAYNDWFGINIQTILYKRRKIWKSVDFLQERITKIIEYRHGLVHEFAIDREFSKKDYLEVIDTIELCMKEVINFLEIKYNFKTLDW